LTTPNLTKHIFKSVSNY